MATCNASWRWAAFVCAKGAVGNGNTGPVSVTLRNEGIFNEYTFPDMAWNGITTLEMPVPASAVNTGNFGADTAISNAKIMLKPGGPGTANLSCSYDLNISDFESRCVRNLRRIWAF